MLLAFFSFCAIQRFFRFFAPITVFAVRSAQINFVLKYSQGEDLLYPAIIAFLMLSCLASFYLFFKAANEKFKTIVYSDEELAVAIKTWHQIHWVRTIIALFAFAFSVFALV